MDFYLKKRYTICPERRCSLLQLGKITLDHIWSHICIQTDNIDNCEHIREEGHYCMVLLLKQYGLVLVNVCNLEV